MIHQILDEPEAHQPLQIKLITIIIFIVIMINKTKSFDGYMLLLLINKQNLKQALKYYKLTVIKL